ncbi:hypothetical protein FB480_1121 [Agrobacterium vitis]|nr:hypothetical protein FB480_1121 [Agrobacterium vitis]
MISCHAYSATPNISRAAVPFVIGVLQPVRLIEDCSGPQPDFLCDAVHRALGKSGALTGYQWALTRRRAMLG